MIMRLTRGAALLLVPGALVLGVLLILPLANVVAESFRLYLPGRIGSAMDAPYTLINYQELMLPAYVGYFADTFRLGFIVSVVALFASFPIAYYIARQAMGSKRKIAMGFLVAMLFLSALVRVYSIELTFGPVGFLQHLSHVLGLTPNSRALLEILVIAGLCHFIIPISALMLVGTLQNLNPRLVEAAQALGAPRWKAHLAITIPLSARGIVSAFLVCFTLSISAFVAPMILGKGKVLFVSNLIFSRFSELGNYPSGSAISVILLVASVSIIYLVSRLAARWDAV
jgi:putative spermidine/putrescine transport system permease protein